jgi:hypothetical protein
MTKRLKITIIISITIIVILSMAVTGYLLFNNHSAQPIIPPDIRQKVTFVIFNPSQIEKIPEWTIDKTKTAYNAENGVLTMVVNKDDITVIFNQQLEPEAFKDVPTQYARMLNSLNQYREISTNIGAVTLTHPKELNGGQTAVADKRETLIFAQPNRDLSDDEWKDFFNSLVVLQ